jgi:hypothetical protein
VGRWFILRLFRSSAPSFLSAGRLAWGGVGCRVGPSWVHGLPGHPKAPIRLAALKTQVRALPTSEPAADLISAPSFRSSTPSCGPLSGQWPKPADTRSQFTQHQKWLDQKSIFFTEPEVHIFRRPRSAYFSPAQKCIFFAIPLKWGARQVDL